MNHNAKNYNVGNIMHVGAFRPTPFTMWLCLLVMDGVFLTTNANAVGTCYTLASGCPAGVDISAVAGVHCGNVEYYAYYGGTCYASCSTCESGYSLLTGLEYMLTQTCSFGYNTCVRQTTTCSTTAYSSSTCGNTTANNITNCSTYGTDKCFGSYRVRTCATCASGYTLTEATFFPSDCSNSYTYSTCTPTSNTCTSNADCASVPGKPICSLIEATYHTCVQCTQNSHCATTANWGPVSGTNGAYQYTATLDSAGTCKTMTGKCVAVLARGQYRCGGGYYSATGLSSLLEEGFGNTDYETGLECTACPATQNTYEDDELIALASGTSLAGSDDISDCYMRSSTTYYDDGHGAFELTDACNYDESASSDLF